jgi:hypothetical protein
MLDTNQIAQIGQTAQVIKTQINPWLPAIAIAAAWLGRELNRFITWSEIAAEKIVAHGGLIKILCKFFWNSEADIHVNRPPNT